MKADELSEAIVIWTGWRATPSPSRDESRVVAAFGPSKAAELMPAIREMEDDFYASDARHVVADLAEMGEVAADQFRSRHPEIAERAVQALAWCYTFDYR